MNESRAAIRYAKATLEHALETNASKVVEGDMRVVLETLEASDELREVLASPVLTGDQKKKVLLKIFHQADKITKNLLILLVENKRISFLGEVASKYIYLNDLLKGEKIAQITTAVPLTSDLEKQLLKRVEGLTGNKVSLENTVDKNIIGGFILRIGDMQFNASIANQLNNLKREFINS
ncbi:MAG: ATP synthase F1 subunit delta [Flavobacteriaceae bacterium]